MVERPVCSGQAVGCVELVPVGADPEPLGLARTWVREVTWR
jgi:hypothetical protein